MVDNASSDDTGAVAVCAGASYVRLETNQGFGRGCNAGAHAATEYLFFVNPDARLAAGCIEALVAAAERRPDEAALQPRSSIRQDAWNTNGARCCCPRTGRRQPPEGEVELPALTGGALFCRRNAFEKVGGFDPAIFLFHEDDDLTIRLRRDAGRCCLCRRPRCGTMPAIRRADRRRGTFQGLSSGALAHLRADKARPAVPWLRTFGGGDSADAVAVQLLFQPAARKISRSGCGRLVGPQRRRSIPMNRNAFRDFFRRRRGRRHFAAHDGVFDYHGVGAVAARTSCCGGQCADPRQV